MLNHDISTSDALAQLSQHDNDPSGHSRRRFLQMVGYGLGGVAIGTAGGTLGSGLFPNQTRDAWAAGPVNPTDGIVVIVGMYGGNDGLNTVIPYGNGKYYDYRAGLAIPQANVLAINGEVGLHPNLAFLKGLYDQGQVAILQGLGYPNPDLSHFSSMATWMNGSAGAAPGTGWVGRWLDMLGGGADLYTAATIGESVPLHLLGVNKRGTAIPDGGFDFGGESATSDLLMYDAIKQFAASSGGRGPWHDAIALAEKGQIEVARTVGPLFDNTLPDGEIIRKMAVAARLINANLGLRIIDASWGDFDSHSNEPSLHGTRMAEFDAALQYFFNALDPLYASQVTIMTFSEFGRTPWSNDSTGTDHGTANNHFVIGPSVKGGLYGQQPSLANMRRWDRVQHTVDFRSMYASVLDGWLGGGASTVLGGNYEKFDLFNAPGANGIGTPPAGVQFSEFVGVTPLRIMDTRHGIGTTKSQIGAASTRTVQVTGKGEVPATNVMAAVLNITAVNGAPNSFFTVWPMGIARPETSLLNTAGGDVVPNLAIAMIGSSGRVNIFNSVGAADCIVDVVGYFTAGSASQFAPLSPQRILDTRLGLGAPKAPIGSAASIDLQVAGQGGVAPDADSVVMNVTVTGASETSYITAWPTGQTMPVASNLNMVRGQTVPNLVIAKLGAGGKVSLSNNAGTTELIADVLGYFRSGVGGRLTPLAPARLLDTRTDGGVRRPVGQTPLTVPVIGRLGVPSAGVTAVIVNVTATEGTSGTYITAYPSGETRPVTSNLNVDQGKTRANLVICKVGTNGAIDLYNDKGAIHLIADVVGYFTG